MARRLAVVACSTFGLWLIVLASLGSLLGDRQGRHTKERLGESLAASVTIGASDLALVRGRLELERLAIRRADVVGHLAIDVAGIRCELAPLGWALLDRDCRELAVRGVRLEVSTAALLRASRSERAPIHAHRIVVTDARLVFQPSAFVPNLGRIEVAIDHAVTGPTTMRTPVSWLLSLRELRARFELPAGVSVQIGYARGVLTAAGSIFGSEPIALPIALPVADRARDAEHELRLIVELGREVAERLVAKRAEDWLRSKLAR